MKLKAYTVNDLDNIGEIITISHDSVDGNNNSLKTFKTNNTIYILNDVVNKISDNNPLYTPIVDSVSPNFTSYDTGVLVRIKGKNLSNLKSIKIQDIDVKIETFNIISDEIVDVIFPPISQSYPNNNPFIAGLKSILFTFNTEFTIILENAFTYYLPAAVINQSAICPGGGTLCNGVGVYNNGQLDTRGIVIQWQCSDCSACNFTQPRYAKIYRDNKLIATTESGAVEYVDRTYTPGILHSYTIKCILPQGNISSFTSAPVLLVYPLSKPIGVIASDRLYTNKIKITWNRFVNWGPYVDGGEGFNIYRNGSTTKLNSSPITTLEYNDFDSALIPETAYTYRVQTVTGIYVSSLSDSATGYKLLGPPSSIEASDGLYPDKVKIEWGALPNVTNYKVYREGTLIHTETSTNFYYDTTGALNTNYLYGVSSVLGSKESTIITDVGFSYIIVKPVINSATLDSATGNITISWQLFSGADSYYLYRDGVLLTSFINSPTTQTYTDTTSKTGKCYSYTLKAESNSVMSVLSDAKTVCVPLNAPVNLAASTTDSTQITLTWSPPTPLNLPVGVGVTYHVYRNNNLLYITLQDDVLTYDDLSTAIGVHYTYNIKAEIIIDSVATLSVLSSSSVGIRPGEPIPLPSNVSATDGTSVNNITVTWNAPGAVTSYTIWREVSVGGGWSTPQNIGNQDYDASDVLTTKTDSLGSSPLTEYYKQYRYSVVANDSISGTSSDYSLTDTGYLKPIIGSFSISASIIYDSKIQISWSAVTGTEEYEIWRSTSAGGSYTKIGTSLTTNYDDTDSSLTVNTSYYYKVKTIFLSTTSDLSTQYATGIKISAAPKIPIIDSITDIYYYFPLRYGECCAVDRTGPLYRIKFLGTNLNEIDYVYFGTELAEFSHINTTDGGYIYRIPRQQGTNKTVNIYIKYGLPEQTITWPTPFTYFGAPVIDTPDPALVINDWNLTYIIRGIDLQPFVDGNLPFTITKLELFSESDSLNTYDLLGVRGPTTNSAITITDVPFMNEWFVNPGIGQIGLRIETFYDLGPSGSFTFSTTKNNYLEYQNAIPKQATITNVIPSFGQNGKVPLSDFVITGTNFTYVDDVLFLDPSSNEYSVAYTKNSDTQITVLAANFPQYSFNSNQFWGIKVRTYYEGTTLYTTYPNAYRFIGTPTITSPTGVIPKYVSTVTPTPITITGTNFIELNSAVSDNNVTLKVSIQAVTPYAAVVMTGITITPDSPITTASNTSITTTVPAISGQPHGQKRSLLIEEDYSKASVSTPTIAAINSIIYCQPPTGTSAPSSGTTATAVTITGTNFFANSVNKSTVKFGTTTASFTGTPSNTSLTVLAPALSGVQTITLETPGGSVTVGSFTYNTSLSITDVSPNTGYVNTSTPITINGMNLVNVDSVTIGGTSVTGTIAINPGGTQITGISAPSSISTPGTYSLVASKSGGITASTNFTYTYPPPTITGVNPNTGILAGGTPITITGSNFITGATVKVGGALAGSVVVNGAGTSLTALTPSFVTAGVRDVEVTTGGGIATLPNAFTYTDAILATITGVNPQYGPIAGGTTITITGTNLNGTTNVTVGGNAAASFSVVNATTITATTPTGSAGGQNVVVTTPINIVTSIGAFTYYGLPGISGVSPSTQTIGSLSNITITGSNLDSTSSVTIGGVSATIVGTPTAASVTVIPPSTLTSGLKTISLTTRGGTNTSFSVTYNLSAPTGVTATDGTDNNKVAISWSSVSGASGYDVYIGISKINTSSITGTSYDDTSATPGTTYAYTVKATDATGSSLVSSSNNGWRNTQPILVMTATDGTYTDKVVITWTNPATTTGITSYSLFRGTTEITSVTSPYNDTGATPGISYTYEVKSVSASGKSLLNTTDTGYTRISSPTGLTASDGSYTNKIALAWTVPTTGTVTGFDLYRDGVKITALGSGIAAYDDTTTTEGISYTYTIKSNSATGDSLASTSDSGWRNIGPPSSGITASQGLLDRITIEWTAVTSATGYNIYRNGSKVNSSTITGTTYDDMHNSSTNSLTVEQSYSYTIESVTAPGVSATKSTAVNGKRVAIPTTVLTASQGTDTSSVVLNWIDVSAEIEYVLYKDNVELSRPSANTTTYTDTTGGVGTSFTYEIAVNTAAGLGSRTSATGWKKIAAPTLTLTQQENQLTVSWSAVTGATDYAIVAADGTPWSSSLLNIITNNLFNPNNQYTITVKARYLISGSSYYSDTSSTSGYTIIAPPSTAPSVTTGDTAKIVVAWNAVSGASTYEVYRNDNSYSSALATGINTSTYNDAAATAGTSYKYKIKSVCANSTSGFSAESLNGVKPLVVLPPTGVTASYGTYTDKVTITWVHAASYDTYKLYYKDSGGVYQEIASGLTGNTYTHIPPLLLDYYEYYLKTVKSGTESNYSLSDSGCFDTYQQLIQCNIGYRNCAPIADLAASYETSAANISLKWTPYANTTGLTGYEIIRSRQQGNFGEDGFQTGSCAFTGYILNSILTVTSINPGNPNWKILPNHTVYEQMQGTNWPVSRNSVILSQISLVGAPGGVGTYQLYSCDSTGWQTTANTGTRNFISVLTTLLNQTVSTPSPSWTTNFLDTVVDPGYDTYYKIRPYKGIGATKISGPQSLISTRYIGNPASYGNTGLGGGRRLMSLPKFISAIYPTGNNNNPLTGSINMPYYIGEYTLGAIKIEIYRDTSIVSTTNITSPTSAMAGNGTPVSQPYNDTTAVSYIPYEYYIKQTINNTGQDQISDKRIGIRGAVPVVTTTTTFYTKIDVSWNSLSVTGNSVSYDVYRDGMFLGNTLTLSYTDTLGAYCSFSGSISSDLTDKTKATLLVTSFSAGVLTLGQYIQYVPSGSSTIDKGWKVTAVSGSEYTIQNMLGLSRTFTSNWTSGDSLYSGAQYQIKANITNTNTNKSIVLTSGTNTTGAIQTGLPTSNVVLTGFTSGSYLSGGPMEVSGVISLTNIVAAEGCGQTGTIVYIDNLGRMDYTYSGTVATNMVEARTYLRSIWPEVKCVKLSANSGASSAYQFFGVVLSNGKLLMWGSNGSFVVTTLKNVSGGKNGAVATTDYTLVGATSKLYLSNATNYADIACGGYHAIALFKDGKVYSSVGNTTYTSNALPAAESATTFTKVAAGNFHSIGLKTDGTVVCWGHGTANTGLNFSHGQAIVPSGLGPCIDIAAGGYVTTYGHSVAVKSNGDVWAWGSNGAGQCGGTATTSKSGPLFYSDGTTAVTGVSKVSAGTGSTAVAYTTPLAGYSTGFIGSSNAGVLGESGYGAVSYISCRHYTNILLTPISSLVDIQYWKYYTEITNYNYDTPEIGNKSYKITKTFAHFGDLFTNNSEPIQDYYEGVYKVSVYRYEEKQFNNQTTNIIPLNETIYERTEILYNTYSFENEACPFKDESGTYSSETQCVIGDNLERVNIDPNIYCRITFSNNTSSVEFNETNYAAFASTINICDCFENKYLTEGLI